MVLRFTGIYETFKNSFTEELSSIMKTRNAWWLKKKNRNT